MLPSLEPKLPNLELTFKDRIGSSFLLDARFRLDSKSHVSRKLVEQPPRGKILRALCILMVLAKYRGKDFVDENGNIVLVANPKQLTWISSLGTSFGKKIQQDFCERYFMGLRFLSARRGSEHNAKDKSTPGIAPYATYHVKQLPLENLKVLRGKGRAAVTGEQLASLATDLEGFEVGGGKKWRRQVATLIAQTKQDRPIISPTSWSDMPDTPLLYGQWKTLLDQFRGELMDASSKLRSPWKFNWYVVGANGSWLSRGWLAFFAKCIESQGSMVRICYHAPSSAKQCLSVKAQLQMQTTDGVSLGVPLKAANENLKAFEDSLKEWRRSTAPFKVLLYRSNISFPFVGIFGVPRKGRSIRLIDDWPVSASCLLALANFYPDETRAQCCIKLSQPSQLLEAYITSVSNFFYYGVKDGYVEDDQS